MTPNCSVTRAAQGIDFASGIAHAPGSYAENRPWFEGNFDLIIRREADPTAAHGSDGNNSKSMSAGKPVAIRPVPRRRNAGAPSDAASEPPESSPTCGDVPAANTWSCISEVADSVTVFTLLGHARIPMVKRNDPFDSEFIRKNESKHTREHRERDKNMEEERIERHNASLAGTVTMLPTSFSSCLQALTTLDLRICHALTELPANIGSLSALVTFYLSYAHIKALPESIGELRALETLDVRCCPKLATIPDSIGDLFSLQTLRLEECDELLVIPEPVARLTQLKRFSCWHCYRLKRLPASFTAMKALKNVDLTSCQRLEALPDCTGLGPLRQLGLSECFGLASLPDWVGGVGGEITALELRSLRVATLPAFGAAWAPVLAELSLLDCSDVAEIPGTLASLTGLRMLDLSGTSITELPGWIDRLVGLENLALNQCPLLASLPEAIGRLPALVTLEISNCSKMCGMLPASLGSAPALETLFVRSCGATSAVTLPEALISSVTLANLSYDHSDAAGQAGPIWLAQLPALQRLHVNNSNKELIAMAEARGIKVGHFSNPRRACRR